ncbi:MAG: Bug family tripartite tricarboxylate transporter substrate binding protein, partial [Acetobacteraceae bacterium]
MNRRFFLAATAASAVLAGTAREAWAAYPDRTIRYVVHVSPGSATDIMARKISSILQKQLHIPVVVENRPGG